MSAILLKLVLILLLCWELKAQDGKVIFEMDLAAGLTDFKPLKPSNTAQKTIDSATSESVITFDGLSRHGGIVTKEWLESGSGMYRLTVSFRGIKGKRTGAFIGYVSKANESRIHSIAMDHDQLIDNNQIFIFDNSDNDWHEYEAIFKGGDGIKLVLEKGNYYGISEDLDAAFKDLEVYPIEFDTTCPGSDAEIKNNYFEKFFKVADYAGKISQKFVIGESKKEATLNIQFPIIDIPCLKVQLYGFDQNGNVINEIQQEVTKEVANNDAKLIFDYSFTIEDLQNFNCAESEIECTVNGATTTCLRYECHHELHFYLDHGATFATKQLEYDYSKPNAAAIFQSMFVVQVYQSTSTFFNILIRVPDITKPCGDRCSLNQEVQLSIYAKNAQGQWLPASDGFAVIWGDSVDFKVICTPANYRLNFFDIFLVLDDDYISLGYDFIQNFDNSVIGEMEFSMPMSAEAGLKQGDPFNFIFHILLTEVNARVRRVLTATFSSEDLPETALSPSDSKFSFDENCTKSTCVSSSCSTADICVCKDEESCNVLSECNAANCTCSEISDMETRCKLIECIQNYGCEKCSCIPPNTVVNADGTTSESGENSDSDSDGSTESSNTGSSGSSTKTTFGERVAGAVLSCLLAILLF